MKRIEAPEPPAREAMNADQLTNYVMTLRADLDIEKMFSQHLADSLNFNADILGQPARMQQRMLG